MIYYFPEIFLQIVITSALAFTLIVAVLLIYMIIKDKQKNEVW
jgi:hypothetical protein